MKPECIRDRFGMPIVFMAATFAFAAGPFLQSAMADEHADSEKQKPDEKSALAEDPLEPPRTPRVAPGMAGLFGDHYWYLPYAMVNEEQGLAFVEAYRDILESNKKPPESLDVPEGKGAGGSGELHRISLGITGTIMREVNHPAATELSTSDVPVIVAQPAPRDGGANVLFMDGRVKFVKYGEFPVTRKFIDALKELDPAEEYPKKDTDA